MPLRIGTWNLEHARGVEKNRLRRERLAAADVDIWVLTETHDDVTPGDPYRAVSSAPRRNGDPRGRWVTIWSRLPIKRAPPVADADRTAASLIDTPLGALVVFGTVLPWHADRGEAPAVPAPKAWQEQYRAIPEQAADWRRFQAEYPDAALCIAGDLNMSLGGPRFYGTAKGRGLLADAMAASDLIVATDFDGVPAGLLEWPMIDHILLPQAWAKRAAVVGAWEGRDGQGRKLSDHSGVVVEVV